MSIPEFNRHHSSGRVAVRRRVAFGGMEGSGGHMGGSAGARAAARIGLRLIEGISERMVEFRRQLDALHKLPVTGLITLSGVSAHSAGLERLGRMIATLPTADEQAQAADELLNHCGILWVDQSAHIISSLVLDLTRPGGERVAPEAQWRIGRRLVHASVMLMPELLEDSYEQDMVKRRMQMLAARQDFGVTSMDRDLLEKTGFLTPVSDEKYRHAWNRSPGGLATRLRNTITAFTNRQIEPDILREIMTQAATLPGSQRGRILTMLLNLLWNTSRHVGNMAINVEILAMVAGLPVYDRITAIEALYNQIPMLPHQVAQGIYMLLDRLMHDMPDTGEFRFSRARRELQDSVQRQGARLAAGQFKEGESLSQYELRTRRGAWDAEVVQEHFLHSI